jgi:hypothetical protein
MREKANAYARKYYKDPEQKAKVLARQKLYRQTPEYKAMREAAKLRKLVKKKPKASRLRSPACPSPQTDHSALKTIAEMLDL